MSDYSKEYNDITKMFPKGTHDFCFRQRFDNLDPGMMETGLICEGFGILAIGKDEDGTELVLLGNIPFDPEWVDWQKFLKQFTIDNLVEER